jgi:hypothetical protein
VGEALLISGALIFGGMISGLVKSHPFYRHQSQKFKEVYQAKLWQNLQGQYSKNEAYWISRAITDYVYDFNRRLYEDVHIERYMSRAMKEKNDLYKLQIESPNVLCEELVVRAVELRVPPTLFFTHMKELHENYMVPMGKLTPASIESMPGASTYYLELTKLPLSTKQMTRYLDMIN